MSPLLSFITQIMSLTFSERDRDRQTHTQRWTQRLREIDRGKGGGEDGKGQRQRTDRIQNEQLIVLSVYNVGLGGQRQRIYYCIHPFG